MIGAFDLVHPQSPDYAARLEALGAKRLTAPGNLKFAAAPLPVDEAELARLRQRHRRRASSGSPPAPIPARKQPSPTSITAWPRRIPAC